MRSLAARLRLEAAELSSIAARTAGATELPGNIGEAADRDREASFALREAAGRIARRLEALASDVDAGAVWLDQAILEARATGGTW
jgi:hypothetical protein